MRHVICVICLLAPGANVADARSKQLARSPAVDTQVARVARGALIRWKKESVQLPGSASTVGSLLSDMPGAIRMMAQVTGQNYVMALSDTPGLFHLSTPRGLLADLRPVAFEHDVYGGRFQAVGGGVYHGPSHTLRGVFALTIDYRQTRDAACLGTFHVWADLEHNPLLRLLALLFRGHINDRAADELEILLAQSIDVIAQKETSGGS